MSTQQSIELWAAIQFLITGLSHITMPRAWAEFFVMLRSRGDAGAFANGFLSLSFGALVVGFHNVWSGLPMVLTVFGWAQIVKAFLTFVVPGHGVRMLSLVSLERPRMFVAPGALLVAVSGVLFYSLATGR